MQIVRATLTSPRRNLRSKGNMPSDDQSLDGTVLTHATERSLASGDSSIDTRRFCMMSQEVESFNLRPNKERTTCVAVEELTINKLRYSSVGLYGRAKESAILKECLDRLTSDGKKGRELVMISGNSGTGKTYLALSLKAERDHRFWQVRP
jgi:predicted ribonuclease YlaK